MLTVSHSEESFGSSKRAPFMCISVPDEVVNFTPWPLYTQRRIEHLAPTEKDAGVAPDHV
jgi:hypothetical protein